MVEIFMLYALAAGLAVAVMTGPLGCFILWRRMAYFGDALSHGALLGVAVALMADIAVQPGILISTLVLAALLLLLQQSRLFSPDAILGILAHGALAIGLVLIAVTDSGRVDITAFLFGDILSVTGRDVVTVAVMALAVLIFLYTHWRTLLMVTLHPDIASAEGVKVRRTEMMLVLVMALVVASSIRLTGVLLVTAMLIIPAASVRFFSRTPTQMAWLAALAGMLSVVLGLALSLLTDAPSGPAIVASAAGLFALAAALYALTRKATARR